MAFVPVPKDLSRVKNKLIFNLTFRQSACFILAAIAGVPFYFLTKGIIGTDIAAIIMVVLMLPFIFFALYEKDGLPLEKIIIYYIRTKKNPKTRPYKTENMYQYLANESKGKGKEVKRIETKKQKKATTKT